MAHLALRPLQSLPAVRYDCYVSYVSYCVGQVASGHGDWKGSEYEMGSGHGEGTK